MYYRNYPCSQIVPADAGGAAVVVVALVAVIVVVLCL